MDVSLWPHVIEAVEPDEGVQMRRLAEAKEDSYTVTIPALTKKHEIQKSQSHLGGTEPELSLEEQFAFGDSLFGSSRKDREHLKQEQQKQKTWYDKKAGELK